jgi:arylsulfatase A-like enzyme
MLKQDTDRLWGQAKLSLYAGLGLGFISGGAFAFYVSFFLHQTVQKQLYFTTFNIFFTFISFSITLFVLALLFLYPLLTLIDLRFSKIRSFGLARVALIIGGLGMLIGMYFMNRSAWFPEISSNLALIGNAAFALLCLALAIALYKMLIGRMARFPELGLGIVFKAYRTSAFGIFGSAYLLLAASTLYWNLTNAPKGPNVVLITIDTLRADHLGCYGYDKNTSPTIDRLAQEGVRFDRMFAQRGLTWPSLTSIMTSLYPLTHGVESNETLLDASFITLPEILKENGYATAAFLTNFFHASNRGFDTKKGGAIGDLDRVVTDLALRWLDGRRNEKFFMWLHYKNPHAPYQPPEEFRSDEIRAYDGPFDGSWATTDSVFINRLKLNEKDFNHLISLYDAEIRSTDSYIAEVLAKLDEMGITDDTFIIFSADHGEELYEHNYYFYHGCSVYDGVLRIPLIFKFPKIFPKGKVIHNLFESIDIAPTVLQALKLSLRPEFEGRSIFHTVFEDNILEWHQVFGERSRKIFVTRTPKWKFIYNPENYCSTCVRSKGDTGRGFVVQSEELYDIVNDPKETMNVVDQHPEIADSLRNDLLAWAERNVKTARPAQQLTKEAEERLRALGYIQ